MQKVALTFTALALLLGGAQARADEEAKKVVAEAVKAHGGAEALAKMKDKSSISKAKLIIPQLNNLEAKMEIFSGAKKFKHEVELSVNGMDIKQITIYNGKSLVVSVNGMKVIELTKKEELEALEEAIFAEEAAGLAMLGSKDIEMSIIGESKVDDTPVIGVRVTKKGHKDVSLFFDKSTHLLRKIENRGMDFQTQTEVGQERIISEYKEVDGVKRPVKVIVNNDGKKVAELEIIETKIVDKLDDDTFTAPK